MNKHLKLAFFIAPALALIAYGLTGYLVPKPKQKSGTYSLQLQGDCRPLQNSCSLISGELELKLISQQKQDKIQLAIVSNQELQALSLALSEDDTNFKQFKIMKSENNKYWQVLLQNEQILDRFKLFRLATQSKQSKYFIETGIRF